MATFRSSITVIICLILLSASASAFQVGYQFKYHNYAESTAILKDLAREHSDIAKLYSIGKSGSGTKEIWCMEITNYAAGQPETKPASYFDGNQHNSEVTGGEVTLYLIYYLLTNYNRNEEVKQIVDSRVTYIVQRADPDGAELFMTGKIDWDNEQVAAARDADGDGRKGEDGSEDIDGDGEILDMRIPDPEGRWKPYHGDPRLMVRRENGDTNGTFYRIMHEGFDNDGDGKVNEDPPFSRFISNRNYPAFWASTNARFRGAGDYPLQEHNSRVVADFILSKPNISMLESYHTTSGIHLRPYAALPDDEFPPGDLQDYSAILAKGTEITTYPVASVYNDFTTIDPALPWDKQPGVRHGVFIDWTYVHLGIFSVTTELWTLEPFLNEVGWAEIPRDRPLFSIPGRYNRPDVQTQVLKWLDQNKDHPDLNGQGFVEWKEFDHPDLGKIEIGGFTRYWLRNPPPGAFLKKVVEDQVSFAVYRSLLTPVVEIHDLKVKKLDGKWHVTAVGANTGYLDTSTQQARNARLAVPDTFTLTVPHGSTILSDESIEIPFMWGTRGSGSVSQYRAEWEIDAPNGTEITVTLTSQKGGTVTKTLKLEY